MNLKKKCTTTSVYWDNQTIEQQQQTNLYLTLMIGCIGY